VKRETRKIKRQCWEKFVSRTEHDLHGRQISAYKIIRNLNRTEKDNLRLKQIVEHTWLDYYQNFGLNNLMITQQKGNVKINRKLCSLNYNGRIGNNYKSIKSQNISRIRRD